MRDIVKGLKDLLEAHPGWGKLLNQSVSEAKAIGAVL